MYFKNISEDLFPASSASTNEAARHATGGVVTMLSKCLNFYTINSERVRGYLLAVLFLFETSLHPLA